MLLWTLLLLLIPQGAGAGDPEDPARGCLPSVWDDPACTEGVVSVSRGAPAQMACNISNLLRHVSICLGAGGQDCRPLFTEAAPGCSSRGGWRLCVQGRSAKMVTEEAQHSQAGQYRWTLRGCQTELKHITLNVSEPPEPPSTTPCGTPDPWPAQSLRSAQDPPPGRLHVALILVPMLLCALAMGGLQLWRRDRQRPVHTQFQ